MLIQPDPSLTDLNRFEVIVKDILFDGANSRLLAHPPETDTELPQGTEIDLVVSSGPEIDNVPDVTGLDLSQPMLDLQCLQR